MVYVTDESRYEPIPYRDEMIISSKAGYDTPLEEIKDRYPQALVLSEETRHSRDYSNNPYAGVDDRYPSKTIFVAFSIGDTYVASPWLQLEDGRVYQTTVDGQTITIEKTGEVVVPETAASQ